MLTEVLWVAGGGALGATARYLVTSAVRAWFGGHAAWGTGVVNVSGSFLLGVVAAVLAEVALPDQARLLVGVGFLGAYTTFSTFALDTVTLAEWSPLAALVNVLANNGLSLLAVIVGITVGRALSAG